MFASTAFVEWDQYVGIRDRGVTASAQVVSFDERQDRGGPVVEVTVGFRTRSGQSRRASFSQLAEDFHAAYGEGGRRAVTVVYEEGEPANVRLSNDRGLGPGILVGPFLGLAVGVLAFVYGRRIGIGSPEGEGS
jgi:hypothetical protein